MKKELLEGLSLEQIEKVKACKDSEELLALAKEEGVELTEEQLSAVNGGICTSTPNCPECGSGDVKSTLHESNMGTWYSNTCKKCGYHWIVNA